MKAFLKGLLFAAIGGAIGPAANWLGSGHFSPTVLASTTAAGALAMVGAYLHPNPAQQ